MEIKMALIKCTECGKEFSDKASCCPNCGCPTEYIVKDIGQENTEEKNLIVHQYKVLDKEFVIDDKLDRYFKISANINNKRSTFENKVKDAYAQYVSIEDVFEKLPDLIAYSMADLCNYAVDLMVNYGIYDFDQNRFMMKYADQIDASTVIMPMVDEYMEILDLESEVKKYHQSVREARKNYWSGGGFSVAGALEGQFKAQLMNIGNTIIHALPDAAARNKDQDVIDRRKALLFKKSYTMIIDQMNSIFDEFISAIIAELINYHKIDQYYFDEYKSISIMNNLDNIPENNTLVALREAFFSAPNFYPTIYYILDNYAEQFAGIVSFADDYGMLDRYIHEQHIELEGACYQELARIYDEEDISDREVLKGALDVCFVMAQNNIDKKDSLLQLINCRLQLPINDGEVKWIKEYIDNNGKQYFTTKLINQIYKSMDDTLEISCQLEKLPSIVRQVCNNFECNLTDIQICFTEKENLQNYNHYEKYLSYASIPKAAKIIALCGEYKNSDEWVEFAVAVTDQGLYSYCGGEGDHYWNWKEFALLPLTTSDDEYYIWVDGKALTIDTYSRGLYRLLNEIHEALKFTLLKRESKNQTTETLIKCTKCGNIINKGESFCRYCGEKVVNNDNKGIIEKYLPTIITDGCLYYFENTMDVNKLSVAISRFGNGVEVCDVLGFVDSSLMHSGKTGIIFTDNAMYIKQTLQKAVVINYSDIQYAFISKEAKTDWDKELTVKYNSDEYVIFDAYYNKTSLKDIINKLAGYAE